MKLTSLAMYFVTGGLFTALIVGLEESGHRTLSGLATLVPVFTLVAYVFIGQSAGGVAVGQHAKVLTGTLVSWVPYMLAIACLAPRVGPQKAILAGLALFAVLALAYIKVADRLKLFGCPRVGPDWPPIPRRCSLSPSPDAPSAKGRRCTATPSQERPPGSPRAGRSPPPSPPW